MALYNITVYPEATQPPSFAWELYNEDTEKSVSSGYAPSEEEAFAQANDAASHYTVHPPHNVINIKDFLR